MPQPQQCRIRAMSENYTPAQGNTGSLTHWVRPCIETASSWLLVRFVSAAPQQEILHYQSCFLFKAIFFLILNVFIILSLDLISFTIMSLHVVLVIHSLPRCIKTLWSVWLFFQKYVIIMYLNISASLFSLCSPYGNHSCILDLFTMSYSSLMLFGILIFFSMLQPAWFHYLTL